MRTTRSRRAENTGFECGHCRSAVPANSDGHYRNHCPYCLWSLHVDDLPGDRASSCRQPNRLVRDGESPDDLDLVLSLPWL